MVSSGGVSPREANGTLMPATPQNKSGRSRAEFQTMGAPQSWPIRHALEAPSAGRRPTTSPTIFNMR